MIFDDGSFAESYRHAVFVDPGTGEVLGQETVYGTSGSLPVRSWIDVLGESDVRALCDRLGLVAPKGPIKPTW